MRNSRCQVLYREEPEPTSDGIYLAPAAPKSAPAGEFFAPRLCVPHIRGAATNAEIGCDWASALIFPVFQPVISTANAKISYHEALARVRDDRDEVLHQDVIDAGERTGLIRFIDIHMLRQVLLLLHQRSDLRVACNVSLITIMQAGGEYLGLIAEDLSVAARLVIEITETQPISQRNLVIGFVEQARQCGCGIALDDFGAGIFTYQDIADLCPEYVKLDGSLVAAGFARGNTCAFDHLKNYSEHLGFELIAEKIESEQMHGYVIECGIEHAQGFYLGRPQKLGFSGRAPNTADCAASR